MTENNDGATTEFETINRPEGAGCPAGKRITAEFSAAVPGRGTGGPRGTGCPIDRHRKERKRRAVQLGGQPRRGTRRGERQRRNSSRTSSTTAPRRRYRRRQAGVSPSGEYNAIPRREVGGMAFFHPCTGSSTQTGVAHDGAAEECVPGIPGAFLRRLRYARSGKMQSRPATFPPLRKKKLISSPLSLAIPGIRFYFKKGYQFWNTA